MLFCCDGIFLRQFPGGCLAPHVAPPLTCIATREYQPYTQAQCGLLWKTQFMYGHLLELK